MDYTPEEKQRRMVAFREARLAMEVEESLQRAQKRKDGHYKSTRAGQVLKDSKGRFYVIQSDGSYRRVRE